MNEADNSLICFNNVSLRREEKVVLKNVNIEIPSGKITAIVGPSGAGKTTFLQLISGQLKPDTGSVVFDGELVSSKNRNELFKLRKRMGMLFQSGALFNEMNVFENIALPLRVHTSLDNELIDIVVSMKLESVGLGGIADSMPRSLSGGMARRVALARAIALDPDLVMYDEPFVGQDPINLGVILLLIKQLNAGLGLTSVVVSHDIQEIMSIAHQVIFLTQGQIAFCGTPSQMNDTNDPFVKQFLNGNPDGPVAFRASGKSFREILENLNG